MSDLIFTDEDWRYEHRNTRDCTSKLQRSVGQHMHPQRTSKSPNTETRRRHSAHFADLQHTFSRLHQDIQHTTTTHQTPRRRDFTRTSNTQCRHTRPLDDETSPGHPTHNVDTPHIVKAKTQARSPAQNVVAPNTLMYPGGLRCIQNTFEVSSK